MFASARHEYKYMHVICQNKALLFPVKNIYVPVCFSKMPISYLSNFVLHKTRVSIQVSFIFNAVGRSQQYGKPSIVPQCAISNRQA